MDIQLCKLSKSKINELENNYYQCIEGVAEAAPEGEYLKVPIEYILEHFESIEYVHDIEQLVKELTVDKLSCSLKVDESKLQCSLKLIK